MIQYLLVPFVLGACFTVEDGNTNCNRSYWAAAGQYYQDSFTSRADCESAAKPLRLAGCLEINYPIRIHTNANSP